MDIKEESALHCLNLALITKNIDGGGAYLSYGVSATSGMITMIADTAMPGAHIASPSCSSWTLLSWRIDWLCHSLPHTVTVRFFRRLRYKKKARVLWYLSTRIDANEFTVLPYVFSTFYDCKVTAEKVKVDWSWASRGL